MSIYDKFGRLRIVDTVTDFPIKFVSTNSSSALPGLVGKPIFDITGSIKVLAYLAYVTGAVENIAVSMSSSFNTASFGSTIGLAGAVGAAPAGMLYNMVTGFGAISSGSGQQVQDGSFISAATDGNLVLDSSVAATGALTFHLMYIPITSGAVVLPRF